MTMVWVVCGAGKGVGKTHLARRLCELLPGAVYAKRGCGTRKPGKPENFFRTEKELASFIERTRGRAAHVVAESNSLARRGAGDIIIFVDAAKGATGVRRDAGRLRARSHIVISPDASADAWRDVLVEKLDDRGLSDALCGVFTAHAGRLSLPEPAVRSKIWFVNAERRVFGAGLARLLEGIERTGTLSEAAVAAKMSYRYAWGLVKGAEKRLGKQLVRPHLGGASGGRSELSAEGRALLDIYKRLNAEVAAFADKRFAEAWKQWHGADT